MPCHVLALHELSGAYNAEQRALNNTCGGVRTGAAVGIFKLI